MEYSEWLGFRKVCLMDADLIWIESSLDFSFFKGNEVAFVNEKVAHEFFSVKMRKFSI